MARLGRGFPAHVRFGKFRSFKVTSTITYSVDALLKNIVTKTYFIDVDLKNIFIKTCSIDADLKQTFILTCQIDADLKQTQTLKQPYADIILRDRPAGYWRLGNSSGTTVTDELGANNGTYFASPTLGVAGLLTDDSNTAVNFINGTYATLPHVSNFGTGDIAYECWVKTTNTDGSMRMNALLLYLNLY